MWSLCFFNAVNFVTRFNTVWTKPRPGVSTTCALQKKRLSSLMMCTSSPIENVPENFDNESLADSPKQVSDSGECPYCKDDKIVECPACEGRGYHGRTITCYYCAGAQKIECPLCTDDIYKFSYTEPANPTFDVDSNLN